MRNKSFSMGKPSPGGVIGVGFITVIGMGILAFASHALSAKRTVTIDPRGLSIEHSMYATTIAKADLKVADAKVLDLSKDTGYVPTLRTNGTGLPGLREGWFKLENGEKALVVVTDMNHVAYIPTTQGHAVLVSVADPAALIAALK